MTVMLETRTISCESLPMSAGKVIAFDSLKRTGI